MSKFSESIMNGFKLYNGNILSETEWNGHLEAIQNGIQEHEHLISGGQNTSGGDAGPIQAIYVKMQNDSGGDLTAGSVVVISANTDNAFSTTTTQDDIKVCGVLAEDIADGSEGWVQISGIANVKVDGSSTAITRGDLISTYTTAGVGGKANTPSVGNILGKALQEASGVATIKVLLTLS